MVRFSNGGWVGIVAAMIGGCVGIICCLVYLLLYEYGSGMNVQSSSSAQCFAAGKRYSGSLEMAL